MVSSAAGKVVLVPFPFPVLLQSKLRPAVVVANAGHGDWALCQITSNPYADSRAVRLTDNSFAAGTLHIASFARPGKLFTASAGPMVREVEVLKKSAARQIVDAIVEMPRSSEGCVAWGAAQRNPRQPATNDEPRVGD